MKIDDDTLVAYLDAQLEDDAAYEAVEDALAESPALLATTMTRLDDWARELRVQIGQLGDP